MKAKTIIGWREWVALPALGIPGIRAKVDTGAKTSAIHAYAVRTEMRDGQPWARFAVHPVQRHRRPEIRCQAPITDERNVTSSNGAVERRLVVTTAARVGHLEFPIELTLTDRDVMGFRMLLGREALRPHFIVDPTGSFALGDHDEALLYPDISARTETPG